MLPPRPIYRTFLACSINAAPSGDHDMFSLTPKLRDNFSHILDYGLRSLQTGKVPGIVSFFVPNKVPRASRCSLAVRGSVETHACVAKRTLDCVLRCTAIGCELVVPGVFVIQQRTGTDAAGVEVQAHRCEDMVHPMGSVMDCRVRGLFVLHRSSARLFESPRSRTTSRSDHTHLLPYESHQADGIIFQHPAQTLRPRPH